MIPRIRPLKLSSLRQTSSTGLRHYSAPLVCNRHVSHQGPRASHSASQQSRRALVSSTSNLQSRQTQPLEPEKAIPADSPGAPSSKEPPPSFSSSSQPKPKPRRRRGRLLFAASFLALGVAIGSPLRLFLKPPPPPIPGTKEDAATISVLHSRAAKLPLVASLLADPAWVSWPAYSTFAQSPRPDRITTGALAGSRGVGGYQQIFHNPSTGEVVTVIWFGGATAGWPGVVHGGAIATILDESLGRCALKILSGGTGVTARLELTYLSPAISNAFYVVRCSPVLDHELAEAERGKNDRKLWCRARLETLEGKVCVEAKGLFVVPKGLNLKRLGEQF